MVCEHEYINISPSPNYRVCYATDLLYYLCTPTLCHLCTFSPFTCRTLLLFGLFVGIIFCWWYKAYKYRQRGTVVQRNVIPMQVVQPYPPHPPMNSHNHQAVPGYPPYTAYAFAPPPYSAAVDQGTVPPPNYYPPNQEPKQQ